VQYKEQEDAADCWLLENHAEWLGPIIAFNIKHEEMYPSYLFSQCC